MGSNSDFPFLITERVLYTALGLSLNRSKTAVLSLNRELPADVLACGARCLDTDSPDEERGIKLLGAPFGSAEYNTAQLREKVAKARDTIARLTDVLRDDPQTAALLLSACVAQRFVHLLHCVPPDLSRPVAAEFDAVMRDGWRAIVAPGSDADLSVMAQVKLALPPSEGGFGLGNMEALAPVAYISSCIGSLQLARRIFSGMDAAVPLTVIRNVAAAVAAGAPPTQGTDSLPWALQSAMHSLTADTAAVLAAVCDEAAATAAEDGTAPSEAASEAEADNARVTVAQQRAHPTHGLRQRLAETLRARMVTHLRDTVLASQPTARAQHLAEAGWAGVNTWAVGGALPRNGEHMTAPVFRLNAAIAAGLPVAAFASTQCLCGRQLDAETGVQHVLSCRRFGKSQRHTSLALAVDRTVLKTLPGAVRVLGLGKGGAPSIGVWYDSSGKAHQRYPDRIITGVEGDAPDVRWIVDHVVANPTRASTAEAGTTPLAAVNEEYAIKQATYGFASLGLRKGTDRILPFAVDLFGGVHPDVVAQLKAWSTLEAHGDKHKAADILRSKRIQIGVALAYTRAEYIQDALDKIHARYGGGRVRERAAYDPFSAYQALDRARIGKRARPAAW